MIGNKKARKLNPRKPMMANIRKNRPISETPRFMYPRYIWPAPGHSANKKVRILLFLITKTPLTENYSQTPLGIWKNLVLPSILFDSSIKKLFSIDCIP